MNVQEYLSIMRKVQESILKYLEDENSSTKDYATLIELLNDHRIQSNKDIFKSILHLIVKISNNHLRGSCFIDKIESILKYLKNSIKSFFTNSIIFDIFKSNKRILLTIIQEDILQIDEYIYKIITTEDKYMNANYIEYFFKELQPFMTNDEDFQDFSQDISGDYEEKRKIGENDNYICEIIRKDLIEEFISYVEEEKLPLTSSIENSIFETNSYLLKYQMTLIEYAAFFGSIKIFRHLIMNKVQLTPFIYFSAIHSNKRELIKPLDTKVNKSNQEKFFDLYIEAIKCHHNDIASFIQNKILNILTAGTDEMSKSIINSLKYHNFLFIQDKYIDESFFYYFCQYDYCFLVKFFAMNNKDNINEKRKITSCMQKFNNHENPQIIFGDFVKTFPSYTDKIEEITKEEKSALYIAVEKGNYEIIEYLLSKENININAIYKKKKKINHYLAKIDNLRPMIEEKTVLHLAIEKGNIQIIDLLIAKENIDINSIYRMEYNLTDIEKILSLNKDPEYFMKILSNTVNYIFSALHIAIEKGNIEIIKHLLNKETIDVNAIYITETDNVLDEKSVEKEALHIAIENGNIEIIKLLLNNTNIDINAIFKKKYRESKIDEEYINTTSGTEEKTALHIAIEKGNIEIINLLLTKENIDINSIFKTVLYKVEDPEEMCRTALIMAVINENIEIIRILLKHKNIDINVTDEKGRKPIDLTCNEEIKKLFRSYERLASKPHFIETETIEKLIERKKLIGKGSTSTVYKVNNIYTQKGFLCVKVLDLQIFKNMDETSSTKPNKKTMWEEEEEQLGDDNEEEEDQLDIELIRKFLKEYEILNNLIHPNIVKVYGFYIGDKKHNPMIVLEYCNYNLENAIKDIEDIYLVSIIYEICLAMKYVHENGIIHRDLKMRNILINLKKHAKICDFGISKVINLTSSTSTTNVAGTIPFMAPEMFNTNKPITNKVDIYAFGVVMYFILSKGNYPEFKGPGSYESISLPQNINKLSQEIIKRCWSNCPEMRPSFSEIMDLIVQNKFMLINGIENEIPKLKKHLELE